MNRRRRIIALAAVLFVLPLTGAFAQGAGSEHPDMMWLTWVGSLAGSRSSPSTRPSPS